MSWDIFNLFKLILNSEIIKIIQIIKPKTLKSLLEFKDLTFYFKEQINYW